MAFEVAFLLFLAVVILGALWVVARPMMLAFLEKTKYRYRDMGSETEALLKDKINILEGELLAVKQQVTTMQETIDFLSREIEGQGTTIKTPEKKQR